MRGDSELRRYLKRVAAVADDAGGAAATGDEVHLRRDVQAAVAIHIGRVYGADLRGSDLRLLQGSAPVDDDRLVPPPALAAPELLGIVHAALQAGASRRRGGVFMTPASVAAGVTAATLGRLPSANDDRSLRVCDPAVGGGAFLLAAARRLAGDDARRLTHVAGHALFGSDLDPLAVAVAEAALAILGWDRATAAPPAGLAEHLVVGNPLLDPHLLPGPFDAVLANPPFLNQLERATVRSRSDAAALAARFGPAAHGYVDAAALFLLLGVELTRAGGRVGMILPDSVLSTAHAAPARQAVADRASLEWVWTTRERVFDAGVAVCAVVAEVGSPQRSAVLRTTGPGFEPCPDVPAAGVVGAASWGPLVADTVGVPDIRFRLRPGRHATIGDECRVTADFRDQFYGLAPLVEEAPADWRPAPGDRRVAVITCGLIDPAVCRWGSEPMRIGGRRFDRPIVDVRRLERETTLGPWARARLVPKILVATQTRTVEAVVDECGILLPSTPVITIEVPPERAWHVAAALMAPPIAAHALRTCAGAALSPDAIKLTAKQVAALPVPDSSIHAAEWDEGAAAVRRAAAAGERGDDVEWASALRHAGEAMCRAYGITGTDAVSLLDWWSARLPRRAVTTTTTGATNR